MKSNQPPKPTAVSPAMGRVLVNLYRGRAPWGHISGRSMHGGAVQTESALIKRGLVVGLGEKMKLKASGRETAAWLTT